MPSLFNDNLRYVIFFCSINQGFEPEWLYTGENFGKVLNTLLAFNFATQGKNLIVCLYISTLQCFLFFIHPKNSYNILQELVVTNYSDSVKLLLL